MDSASERWVGYYERDNFDKYLVSFLEGERVEEKLIDRFMRYFVAMRGRANIYQICSVFTGALIACPELCEHLEQAEFPVNNLKQLKDKCKELCGIIVAEVINRGLD